ncbi:MAG: helix-turn-helix domain-containing protein [Ruminococcus flavefaciens]|nr:helix-turn-helix domain-containing protein [Ruminococcus flavefaciens]MCM1228896.1 helix-turn-helix domain-containing protein [Ruminococcus flavefaciens]
MENIKDENIFNVTEKDWKAAFAKNLRNLILTSDTNCPELAFNIGVDTKTLDNYMKGNSLPNAFTLLKIARCFNISVDYLVTGVHSDYKYSAGTLRELANLIANFDIRLNLTENINKYCESVSLTVHDRILAHIITELCMTPEADFKEHADKIVSAYGNMKVFEKHLVDYKTFCNMIEDRFLYDGLEEEIEACGMITEIYDEIEERKVQWAGMSDSDREEWWKNWLKEHGHIN